MLAPDRPHLIRTFLSEDEVEGLNPPTRWFGSTVDTDAGAEEVPQRTSTQRQLCDRRVIRLLEGRLRAHVGALGFEEGSWVKYEVGQYFQEHGDAAGMRSGRLWTLLVCVRPPDEGGETEFTKRGETFRLARGDALVWCNYVDGRENERMDHRARPVRKGTKIVINAWFS